MLNTNVYRGLLTVLSVTAFAVIAFFITQGSTLAFDSAVQQGIFSMRSDWLTPVMQFITFSGNWQPIAAVCAVLLLLPQTRRAYGLPLTFSAVLSVAFHETLKFIFQRPRPDLSMRLIQETGFSFPSGHTLTSLVFWGSAIMLIRFYSKPSGDRNAHFPHLKSRPAVNLTTGLLGFYIFLIGFSRLYLGVHYPTDVIGSWCLGTCILTGLYSTHFTSFPPEPRV